MERGDLSPEGWNRLFALLEEADRHLRESEEIGRELRRNLAKLSESVERLKRVPLR